VKAAKVLARAAQKTKDDLVQVLLLHAIKQQSLKAKREGTVSWPWVATYCIAAVAVIAFSPN
jgi:hypothetical protein